MILNCTKQKVNQQLRLEAESVAESATRYQNKVMDVYGKEKDTSQLLPENKLLRKAIGPLAQALCTYLKPKHGGSRLDRSILAKRALAAMNPYELSFITTRFAFNIIKKTPMQRLCIQLGSQVEDHHDYLRFKEKHGGFVFVVESNFKSMNMSHKTTVLKVLQHKLGVADTGWDEEFKFSVGYILLEKLVEYTGLFQIARGERASKKTGGTFKTIEMSPATRANIDKLHGKCEILNPTRLPMVVQPKDWVSFNEGGFLSHKVDFIRSRNREVYDIASTADLTATFEAVNTIQRTPWRINHKICEVLTEAKHTGLGGLPMSELEPELTPPFWDSDEEFQVLKQEQPGLIKEWMCKRAEVYNKWHREASKRTSLNTKVRIANQFKDEEAIWFVWNLDWRGRLYCVQNCFIHPQSDDTGKALIEFAEGKPLGADGPYWLAVHGSNCYGNDKVSFDERVSWVKENQAAILASAQEPFENRFWCEADEPYMFLAFCFEWLGYVEQGEYFESHLPVNMDGSCSGLQHFSALLRDEQGAKAVNLIPSEIPSDIYQQVADVANGIIDQDVREGITYAKMWQGKVNRKWTKRNTMTSPYSATLSGFKEQIVDELKKYSTDSGEDYLDDSKEDWNAANYLANVNKTSIGKVVVKAVEAMNWLQEVSKVLGKEELPIMWTTPTGFKVLQKYKKMHSKRIKTLWGGTRVDLSVTNHTNKIATNKQAAGIAPNYIHSMDASHLVLTVNKCKKLGITNFSMIHDSFGCHACDLPTLNKVIRETFMEMYSTNQLQRFYEEVKAQLPNEDIANQIPEPPTMGSLDISLVKQSRYFFA